MDNKNFKIISAIVLVVVAVAVISITYAAFTQQLTINGTATAKATSWDIKFENLQDVTKTGTAEEVQNPSLTDTTIKDFDVSVKTPGDSIMYEFDVHNAGSFNAKISSLSVGSPICQVGGSTTQDATNVCGALTYELKYKGGLAVANDDTLDAGAKKTMQLTLTYSSTLEASKLPTSDVDITGLTTTINYIQTT